MQGAQEEWPWTGAAAQAGSCLLPSRPSGWVASPWEGLETVAHSFPTHLLGEKRKGILPLRRLPPAPHPGRVPCALYLLRMKPNQPGLVSVSSPPSCPSPFGPLRHQLWDSHRLGPKLPLVSCVHGVKPSPASEQQLGLSQRRHLSEPPSFPRAPGLAAGSRVWF